MENSQPKTNTHEAPHVTGLRLALVMVGLCLAMFLTGMDQTVLATAAPQIANDFKTLDDLGWWTDIYLLTLSSFQLFYGRLYSLYSIKAVYLITIVIFEAGSLICALTPNATALIFGRAIAGLGAAGIFSGGVMITTILIPLARCAAYLGIMSGVFGLAAILGPFIGGALTDRSTWRWCFGINLPIGAVTILLCILLVRTPKTTQLQQMRFRRKLRAFDVPGTITMIVASLCLLLALQWGGSKYPWSNARVIALFVVAGVLGLVFVGLQAIPERWVKARAIPEAITKSCDIWLAVSYAMSITGGVYVAILYLPVWSQAIEGDNALSSGVSLTPLIVGYVVASIAAGIATSAVGYYNPAMLLGTALAIAGAALMTTFEPAISTSRVVGYQLLFGLGIGFGFGQPSYIVQTILSANDVPIGVSLITMMQNLSASIFVAVAQAIFLNSLYDSLGTIDHNISPLDLSDLGATNFISSLPPAQKASAIALYSQAIVRTLYISLGLVCFSTFGAISVKWRSMKEHTVSMSSAEHESNGANTKAYTSLASETGNQANTELKAPEIKIK